MNSIEVRQPKRQRGYVLSDVGKSKLQTQLLRLESQKGYKFTLQALARQVQLVSSEGLHSTTIRKIVEQQTGVDERSLKILFESLELELEPQDCRLASQEESLTNVVGGKAIEVDQPQFPDFPGGPVPLGSPYYIERTALQQRAHSEISRPGGLIRVKAPQKMGKSSFMLRLLHHATSLGYRVLQVDLKQADEAVFSSIDRFLRWFFTTLHYQLDKPCTLDDYWDQQAGSKVSSTIYLQQVLLKETGVPIVLVFKEINDIFEHPAIFREFLPLLRSWYEEAKSGSSLQKLRFVLGYSTDIYVPLNLNQSPFNIGLPINLPRLTANEAQALAKVYGLSSEVVSPLMELVGGHPYLIQLSFYHLWSGQFTLSSLLRTAATPVGIYSNHLNQNLTNLQERAELVTAFRQVVQAEAGVALELEVARKLESLGLIESDDGLLAQPSCMLYQQFFATQLASVE